MIKIISVNVVSLGLSVALGFAAGMIGGWGGLPFAGFAIAGTWLSVSVRYFKK